MKISMDNKNQKLGKFYSITYIHILVITIFIARFFNCYIYYICYINSIFIV